MANHPKSSVEGQRVEAQFDDEEENDPLDPRPLRAGRPPGESAFDDDGFDSFGVDMGDEVRRPGGVTDVLRKAVVAGLGAVFMTEEGIRALVKDLKLPKDVMGFVLGQAERSKTELYRIIGEEMRHFFESAALRGELVRLLSDMTVEIKAEIRMRPDNQLPDVKVTSTSAHRSTRKKD